MNKYKMTLNDICGIESRGETGTHPLTLEDLAIVHGGSNGAGGAGGADDGGSGGYHGASGDGSDPSSGGGIDITMCEAAGLVCASNVAPAVCAVASGACAVESMYDRWTEPPPPPNDAY